MQLEETSWNQKQREAICAPYNIPLLIIAGPGSGKTRVIIERVIHLIRKEDIVSSEILCLTFSKKAADEMKERLESKGIINVNVSTYHAFCRDICTENAEATGLGNDTKIIQKASMLVWCMKNTDSFNFDPSVLDISGDLQSIYTAIHEGISTFKEEMITPEEFESWLLTEQKTLALLSEKEKSKKDNMNRFDYFLRHQEFNKVFKSYVKYEKDKHLIDYDDMINKALVLLKTRKAILYDCHEKYKYILVDEFQDNNYAQFELLKLLVKDGNITVVGDEDQLIYSFQGASQNNFSSFEQYFNPIQKIYLEENYRSSKNIVDVGKLLLPNKGCKKLYSNLEQGESVKVVIPDTDRSQIEYVLEIIRNLVGTKFIHRTRGETTLNYKDFAILSRKKETGDKFALVFKSYGIPSFYVGNYNIFSNPIIRELLDYLRVTNSPSTSGQSLYKIMERRGIDDINIQLILEEAQRKARYVTPGNPDYVFENMKYCNHLDITQKIEILEIIDLIENFRKEISQNNLLEFLRKMIYEYSGVFQRCLKYETLEGRRNIAILNAFYSSVEEFCSLNPTEGLISFLQHIDYLDKFDLDFEEVTSDNNSVQIMTMHKSKGKEFPIVFITDVVQGRFPPNYRIRKYFPPSELIKGNDKERHSKEKHLEEEKRLFYVAISRAQNQLFIMAPKKFEDNITEKKVSKFLEEIEYNKKPDLIQVISYNGKGLLETTQSQYYERVKKEIQKEANLAIDHMSITTAAHKLLQLARIKYYEQHRFDDPECTKFNPTKVFDIDLSQVPLDLNLNGNVSPLFNENNLTLSPSSIETYNDCPLKFKLDRLRVPGKNKSYFDLGKSVHSTIEEISKRKLNGDSLTRKDALDILEKEWIFRTFESGQQENINKSQAIEIIDKYLEMEKNNQNEIVGIEVEFTLKRNNITINGKIDRIEKNGEGELHVIDYKTSKTPKKAEKLVEDIQLNVYAHAVREKYDKLPQKAILVYLRQSPVVYEVSEQNVDVIIKSIDNIIIKILNNEFDPNPSTSVCRNCQYKEMCEFAEN